MSEQSKGRALGLGGIFFRAEDPQSLGEWYRRFLGIEVESWGETRGASFFPDAMPQHAFTVWSAFPRSTEYFGSSDQPFMINLVVDDLDAALRRVSLGGAEVLPEREEQDYGRFGWFVDPEGNRVELWQPPDQPPTEFSDEPE